MADKSQLYKRVKIAALISYIPIVLLTAPFLAYLLAGFLKDRYNLPYWAFIVLICAGFFSGTAEVVRILRRVIKIDREP